MCPRKSVCGGQNPSVAKSNKIQIMIDNKTICQPIFPAQDVKVKITKDNDIELTVGKQTTP